MAENPKELRIGDAERTAAAEELGEHYAQGRLSADEHQERLDGVMSARTASELAPLFRDLPGSRYQPPRTHATADRPGVGSDRRGGATPYPAPPFGRPPFGRPPYVGPGRGQAAVRGFRGLPLILRLVLVIALVALVLTHLPLILIGLLVWVVLASRHRRWHTHQHRW